MAATADKSLKDYVRMILESFSPDSYKVDDETDIIWSLLLADYVLQGIEKSRYRKIVYDEMTGYDSIGCGPVWASCWKPRSYQMYNVAVDIVDDDMNYETKRLLDIGVADRLVYRCVLNRDLAIHLWYRPEGHGMIAARDEFNGTGGGTTADGSGSDCIKSLYKNPFEEEVHYGKDQSCRHYFTTFCGQSTYCHESDDRIHTR